MEIAETNGRLSCCFGEMIDDKDDEFASGHLIANCESSQKICGLGFDGIKASPVQG